MAHDVEALIGDDRTLLERAVTPLVLAMTGSQILAIAGNVRALKAQGRAVCDLTVGDFAPEQFRIPSELADEIVAAIRDGQTNYPPAAGIPSLRSAIAELYARDLGLRYPDSSIVVASGARPVLYACWQMFTQPGDVVISSVPMWNVGYYAQLFQARQVILPARPETNFFPTAAQIEPHLASARMVMLNSPLNPTGTAIDRGQLRELCQSIVVENRRRENRPPVMLIYDQVYWMLTAPGVHHEHPIDVVPEIAPYVVYVDAISKSFASTGLRVGWAAAPPTIAAKMAAFIGHVGAWAPRAEQVATAAFLSRPNTVAEYTTRIVDAIGQRLGLLHEGIRGLRNNGHPIDAIAPQGAMYLSVRIDLRSNRFPDNESIRQALLDEAGIAVVPFQAFDLDEDTGWFRMSVGAVSVGELHEAMDRLGAFLQRHSQPALYNTSDPSRSHA